jgi:hypothetical protein
MGFFAHLYTQFVTVINYSANANSHKHTAVHYSMYEVFSVCSIFTGYLLITASKAVASSASMFTSLLASDSLATNSNSSNYRLKTPSQSQLLLVV